MKSNLPEIMNKKGITIRELQEKASYVVKGEDGGKTVNISTATILAARDNKKIESCRVLCIPRKVTTQSTRW
jgi:anthranilate phosphoribosyltransferase